MARTADIHLRVEPEIKQRWEEAAANLGGMSLTALIKLAVEEKIRRGQLMRPAEAKQ